MQHLADALNSALAHHRAGRHHDAEILFRQVLDEKPDIPDAWLLLGLTLAAQNKLDDAITAYRRAIAYAPQSAAARLNLAEALMQTGQVQDAIEAAQSATHLAPADFTTHYTLGKLLYHLAQHEPALSSLQRAIELAPTQAWPLVLAGHVLVPLGRIDDAIRCYRRAVELDPNIRVAHDNLLLLAHYNDFNPRDLFEQHKVYAHRFAAERPTAPHDNSRDPNRVLKVAYLSSDFFAHPVATFLLPILKHLPRDRFHTTCYHTGYKNDAITAHLRDLAGAFHDVRLLSDDDLANLIRSHQIDILVDLAGHTADNRLPLFALKPAPIAVTHFAYPNTTGLTQIDYRITDAIADPQDSALSTQDLYAERLLRLPHTAWCYHPYEPPPDPTPPPSLTRHHITLGCLNNPLKLSPTTLDTFARILTALPTAHLHLRALPGPHWQQNLHANFARHNIDPTHRIHFIPSAPRRQYLAQYNDIDIALDCFPYNGGITTCDALLMSVPVVTLAGQTYLSRQGLSVLTNLGATELIAHTPKQYIDLVMNLAHHRDRLTQLRSTLRDRLQASPLMNATQYTTDLAHAYRHIWRAWCR